MENDERDLQNSTNKSSSQSTTVNSFGVSTSDKKDLKSNIENNKQKNLNNQNINNKLNINNSFNNQNSSDLKSRIDESRAKNLRNNVAPTKSSYTTSSTLPKSNELDNAKNKLDSIKADGAKVDKSSSSKDTGKKGGGLGGLAANSALNLAASKSEAVNKGVKTVNFTKTAVKATKAIITFFASPLGWGTLLVVGILFLIFLLGMVAGTVIDSIASFFGLTGSETYETFNEKYEENMPTGDLDKIMSDADAICDRGWFTATKNFFGVWDTTNECELAHYVRKMIDEKEKSTSISILSPGYFMSAIYYAYDTQNTDEDGNLYIKPKADDEDEVESMNDLNAITTVISSGLYDKILRDKILGLDLNFYNNVFGNIGLGDLFTEASSQILLGLNPFASGINTIKFLLGQNTELVNEVMLNNILDENILHYRGNYSYFRYETITSKNNETGEETTYQTCVSHNLGSSYEVDNDKFKLYLRYGAQVSQAYEDDMDKVRAYDRTSSECLGNLGFNKPDMDKYKIKANTDSVEDDNAKITISNGTYGYDSGFIFNTYPRYMKEYTPDKEVVYNYWIDKDIEQIISNIESRQDYTNYILGYPSSIKKEIISSGAVCTYNINGKDVSNIKVRLLHAKNNSAIKDVEAWAPIEGQELIDFDKYILGVVYAEEGGAPVEAMKAEAIAAASYALGHANSNGSSIRMIEENGVNILEISSSTFHQVYCDPDKGCFICSENGSGNETVLTDGTIPAGANCTHWKGPLSNTSNIRSAVRSVSGMVLVDNKGKIFPSGYDSATHNSWNEMAKNGLDYVEILRKHYGSEYSITSPTCTYGATGEWASWKQCDSRWGSRSVGSSNVCNIGCFITSYAMILAKSAPLLSINDFNPGTFTDSINRNSCLSGNNLISNCAVRSALGEGVTFSQNSISIGGMDYNSKVALISQYLSQGYDIMLRVKSPASARKYGGSDQHWVVVTGINGTDILMADPASGNETVVLDKYHDEGIITFTYMKFNKE